MIQKDETQELRIYDAEDSREWPQWIHQRMADKKKRMESKMSNVV